MRKNINQKFLDPKNIKTFESYDFKYAEKILKKFTKLNNDTVHSEKFYNDYFKDFGVKSVEISKLFSQLKHK